MSLDGLRESRQPAPHGWAGTILDDADTLQSHVRVRLDAFRDSRRHFGPMGFTPGSVLPQEGDRCMVMFDERRQPAIVWWQTAQALPGG